MAEITRLHSDQSQHNDLNSQLIQHNKHLDTELANTRERNMNDGEEINKVNYTSSMKEKESLSKKNQGLTSSEGQKELRTEKKTPLTLKPFLI